MINLDNNQLLHLGLNMPVKKSKFLLNKGGGEAREVIKLTSLRQGAEK
jgi:hypothetical protein